MQITNTVYAPDRETWRAWLEQHAASEREVWLIFPRKATGLPRVAYNDAVEEALCFGWIDSIQKTLDADRVVQRFSPRRPNIPYSQTNKERLRRLIAQGKVRADVLATVGDVANESFTIPADILAALQADEAAWANFQRFSGAYQRIRIAYIDHARKRPGEFEKRLQHLVDMTAKGKQFGFGIESYY